VVIVPIKEREGMLQQMASLKRKNIKSYPNGFEDFEACRFQNFLHFFTLFSSAATVSSLVSGTATSSHNFG
jgi:hypothetical protein